MQLSRQRPWPWQQLRQTRKLRYRKDDRAMRPIYECPENFRVPLSTPTVSSQCDPPTSQTERVRDGQTDGQTTCNLNTALCTKVHRAAKIDGVVFGPLYILAANDVAWRCLLAAYDHDASSTWCDQALPRGRRANCKLMRCHVATIVRLVARPSQPTCVIMRGVIILHVLNSPAIS